MECDIGGLRKCPKFIGSGHTFWQWLVTVGFDDFSFGEYAKKIQKKCGLLPNPPHTLKGPHTELSLLRNCLSLLKALLTFLNHVTVEKKNTKKVIVN